LKSEIEIQASNRLPELHPTVKVVSPCMGTLGLNNLLQVESSAFRACSQTGTRAGLFLCLICYYWLWA